MLALVWHKLKANFIVLKFRSKKHVCDFLFLELTKTNLSFNWSSFKSSTQNRLFTFLLKLTMKRARVCLSVRMKESD